MSSIQILRYGPPHGMLQSAIFQHRTLKINLVSYCSTTKRICQLKGGNRLTKEIFQQSIGQLVYSCLLTSDTALKNLKQQRRLYIKYRYLKAANVLSSAVFFFQNTWNYPAMPTSVQGWENPVYAVLSFSEPRGAKVSLLFASHSECNACCNVSRKATAILSLSHLLDSPWYQTVQTERDLTNTLL